MPEILGHRSGEEREREREGAQTTRRESFVEEQRQMMASIYSIVLRCAREAGRIDGIYVFVSGYLLRSGEKERERERCGPRSCASREE